MYKWLLNSGKRGISLCSLRDFIIMFDQCAKAQLSSSTTPPKREREVVFWWSGLRWDTLASGSIADDIVLVVDTVCCGGIFMSVPGAVWVIVADSTHSKMTWILSDKLQVCYKSNFKVTCMECYTLSQESQNQFLVFSANHFNTVVQRKVKTKKMCSQNSFGLPSWSNKFCWNWYHGHSRVDNCIAIFSNNEQWLKRDVGRIRYSFAPI